MKKAIYFSLILFSFILNIILIIIYVKNYQYYEIKTPFEIKTIQNNSEQWKYIINNINNEIKNDEKFRTCMTNNTNICLNQYISEKAINTSDYTVCNELSDSSTASLCKEVTILSISWKNNDINLCNELWEKKSYCVSQILTKSALEKLDPKICESIEDEKNLSWTLLNWNYEKICKNNVFFQLWIKNKDKSYCLKIQDNNMQKICIDSTK